jgi:AbrB family looped-hinge helix DNA binding protein
MVTATVTSKGQVTIPKQIREALGLAEHSRLLFVLEGETARLVPLGGRSLTELAGSLAATRPWPGMAEAREAYRRGLVDQQQGDEG